MQHWKSHLCSSIAYCDFTPVVYSIFNACLRYNKAPKERQEEREAKWWHDGKLRSVEERIFKSARQDR